MRPSWKLKSGSTLLSYSQLEKIAPAATATKEQIERAQDIWARGQGLVSREMHGHAHLAVSTRTQLRYMADYGFYPVAAAQNRGNNGILSKHFVILENKDHKRDDGGTWKMVVQNSNDGTSSYRTLLAQDFDWCENLQFFAKDVAMSFTLPHRKYNEDLFVNYLTKIGNEVERLAKVIGRYSGIEITGEDAKSLAQEAIKLRFTNADRGQEMLQQNPELVSRMVENWLTPRRPTNSGIVRTMALEGGSLLEAWQTLEEAGMRAGSMYITPKGKVEWTRPSKKNTMGGNGIGSITGGIRTANVVGANGYSLTELGAVTKFQEGLNWAVNEKMLDLDPMAIELQFA